MSATSAAPARYRAVTCSRLSGRKEFHVPRSIRLLLTLCALSLLAPAAAQAQASTATAIDGNPLKIYVSGDGSIQTNVAGSPVSEFYPPYGGSDANGNPIPSQTANAGFGMIVDPENTSGGQFRFGRFGGQVPTPDSGPTLTPGNPATISTTWTYKDYSGNPLFQVTQLISYTTGQRQFESSWRLTNVSGRALPFRAYVAGDLAIRGSDSGVGFLEPGPPRFMGGVNQQVGAAGGFVEETPWSHFESNTLSQVSSHVSDPSPTGGFDDSLSTQPADNAAGVQWDDHYASTAALQNGESATYNLGWRFVDTLGLSPISATRQTGEQHTVTLSLASLNGTPTPNQVVAYRIDGPNTQTGTVKTDSTGHATISWVGGAAGRDMLTAFIDTNGNGIAEPTETQATATVDWTGATSPPVIGQTAGVRPLSGTVKIKLPPGTSVGKAKRLGLQGAAFGFIPLTAATTIPLGSTLDTSKGKVQLFTAAGQNTTQSKFQTGDFNGGQFRLGQTRKNPLTTLSMTGGGLSACHIGTPKGGAARARRRSLFGNAHGRFRTRGRNSSATVRGTQWTMTDTCAGTLTTVKRGTVIVRDFRLKKNKTVRAGHKYLARSFKLKKK
jgi:hypothetical protein